MNITYSQFCYTVARTVGLVCLIVALEKSLYFLWSFAASYEHIQNDNNLGKLNSKYFISMFAVHLPPVIAYTIGGVILWKKATTIASWLEKPEN